MRLTYGWRLIGWRVGRAGTEVGEVTRKPTVRTPPVLRQQPGDFICQGRTCADPCSPPPFYPRTWAGTFRRGRCCLTHAMELTLDRTAPMAQLFIVA